MRIKGEGEKIDVRIHYPYELAWLVTFENFLKVMKYASELFTQGNKEGNIYA